MSLSIFATILGVRIEVGSALTPELSRSRPADALVNNWIGGSSAAFDVRQAFSHLASRLSFGIGHQKSKFLVD